MQCALACIAYSGASKASSRNFGLGWKGRGNFTTYVPPSNAKSTFCMVLHGANENVYASSLFSFPPVLFFLFWGGGGGGELGALEFGGEPPHETLHGFSTGW